MKKVIVTYLIFIGSYILVYTILDIAPLLIDFWLGVSISFLVMITTFIILNKKYCSFNNASMYFTQLISIILFSVISFIYDKLFGLTSITPLKNGLSFTNSKFYEYTLSLMHALLLSSFIFLIYSIFKRDLKKILLSVVSIVIFTFYFILTV